MPTEDGEWRMDLYGRRFFATPADCRYIAGITTLDEYRREHAQEHAAWKEAEARAAAERKEAARRAKTQAVPEVTWRQLSRTGGGQVRSAVLESVRRCRERRGARRRIA
jgi:hypothetical protein